MGVKRNNRKFWFILGLAIVLLALLAYRHNVDTSLLFPF